MKEEQQTEQSLLSQEAQAAPEVQTANAIKEKPTKPKTVKRKKKDLTSVSQPQPATRLITVIRNGVAETKEIPASLTPSLNAGSGTSDGQKQTKQAQQLITETENKYLREASLEKFHKDWPVRLTCVWILQKLLLADLQGLKFLPKTEFYKFNYPVVGLALSTLQWKQQIVVNADDTVTLKVSG